MTLSKLGLTSLDQTPQEILDRVYHHFLVEKKPPGIDPERAHQACVYRRADDPSCGCAIGILVPDPLLPHLQIGSIRKNLLLYPVIQEFFQTYEVEYLQGLQTAHDQAINRTTAHLIRGHGLPLTARITAQNSPEFCPQFREYLDQELRTFAFRQKLHYPETG
jgi:hypothetical protein